MNCPNCSFPECGYPRCVGLIYTKGRRCPCCTWVEENYDLPYRGNVNESNAAKKVVSDRRIAIILRDFQNLDDDEKREFARRAWRDVLDVFGID